MAGKYDHIDFKPPASVAAAAARGLALRQKAKKSHKGGLTSGQAAKEGVGSGVQRAVNLKNRNKLSPTTVRRMLAFFQRHEKSSKIDKGKTALTDKGYQAFCLWGSSPGYAWARKIVRQMDAADRKNKTKQSTASADSALQNILNNILPAEPLDALALNIMAHRLDGLGLYRLADWIDSLLVVAVQDQTDIDSQEAVLDDVWEDSRNKDYSAEDRLDEIADKDLQESTAEEIASIMEKGFRELGLSVKIEDSPMHVDIILGEEEPQLISIDRVSKQILFHDGQQAREIINGAYKVLRDADWTEDYL